MILDKIISFKKEEVARSKAEMPLDSFKSKLKKSDRDFKKAISGEGLGIIAEIKRKSPSEGVINLNFNFEDIALAYKNNNHVQAISVLTDFNFFGGKLELIEEAKKLTEKPVLRKDFIIDEYQIYESRLYGADAVLLIARILTKGQIEELINIAKEYDMDCLLEIHNESEVGKIPENAEIIGINNRDLDTLKIDLGMTGRVAPRVRKSFPNCVIVSESGINSPADARKIGEFADAMLIGTSLMKSGDIDKKINSFFIPRIKICGITNLNDAKIAAESGADYLGFIFYERSLRYIDEWAAKAIIDEIRKSDKTIKFVGVFVNSTIDRIKRIKKLCGLDFIQLHGDEPDDFLIGLKEQGEQVIKAFRIKDKEDIERINQSSADFVLLDTFDKNSYGGTGKNFDWSILDGVKGKKVFLSGGITPDNIQEALKLNTYVIDISSGVEKSPGIKDRDKLRKLFSRVTEK